MILFLSWMRWVQIHQTGQNNSGLVLHWRRWKLDEPFWFPDTKNVAMQIMPLHVWQINKDHNHHQPWKQQKALSFFVCSKPHFNLFHSYWPCMYVCCVADTRHTYPRLERKPAAVPEGDGKCYIVRVPDPAVHSLVPEPYLLWPGLAGVLQGWSARIQWFVPPWLYSVRLFPALFHRSFAVCTAFRFTKGCWKFGRVILLFYCSVVDLTQTLWAVFLDSWHRSEMSSGCLSLLCKCV